MKKTLLLPLLIALGLSSCATNKDDTQLVKVDSRIIENNLSHEYPAVLLKINEAEDLEVGGARPASEVKAHYKAVLVEGKPYLRGYVLRENSERRDIGTIPMSAKPRYIGLDDNSSMEIKATMTRVDSPQ